MPMHVSDAIQQRRSIKRFTSRPVTKEEIAKLLDAARMAPNHKMTKPWKFYVLGPNARFAYGAVLGGRKAKKMTDPEAAAAMPDVIGAEHKALPGMIVVAVTKTESAEQREEDYATMMMGIQNMALAAVEMGLGTHIKTGAVMDDPGARAAAGVGDNERIVAIVNVGEPAEVPAAKSRATETPDVIWRD